MFGLTKKVFFTLLSFSGLIVSMANDSSLTACISLNNQPCITRSTLVDLNSYEYNQGLGYYTFMVNLDRCNGSCNILDDPSDKTCLSNKTENVNLSVFNTIVRINKLKTLT